MIEIEIEPPTNTTNKLMEIPTQFVNSSKFMECPMKEACVRNHSIYEDYSCSPYYTGNLCHECIPKFAKKGLVD